MRRGQKKIARVGIHQRYGEGTETFATRRYRFPTLAVGPLKIKKEEEEADKRVPVVATCSRRETKRKICE